MLLKFSYIFEVELINFRNFDVIKTFKMVKILHL